MTQRDWLAAEFEEYRDHLHAVAYRLLGSVSDAEDAVQDTWLRLTGADTSGVENLGGWLTTVVARVSLNMLRSRRHRQEYPVGDTWPGAAELAARAAAADGPAAAAPASLPADPEDEAVLADSVGLALLVVLDTLTPAERLSFVLHDLFAMPFTEVPAFMARLRERESASARALELVILTAARSGEVRLATWQEIDLEKKLWTIPAERMKAGKAHEVPLTKQAVELLTALPRIGAYVFPGAVEGKALSDMALMQQLRGLDANGYKVHAFRSSFRDWAGDESQFDRETIEHALAHQVPDETERAYRRSTALKKRVLLMQSWANYCDGRAQQSADVISMRG